MHNLCNTKHTRLKFDSANVTAVAWDVTDDSALVAFGPTESNPVITLKRIPGGAQSSDDALAIASWDALPPHPNLVVDRILDLQYFPDTKTTSLVLEGGDLVVVREDPQPGEDFIEIVGSVDAGITAAAWSPDEELLAVTTAEQTLLLMTRAYESAANTALSVNDVEVSNHVSVGWGRRETQFQGRGVARTLRDPTVPEHVDEGSLSPSDNGRVRISWRGDGQYLAVNSILDVQPPRRIVRVYSRDGKLDSVSEPVNGLEGALSWKPSGQLIAGVQRKDNFINIVFFERNGLRHGEFPLRDDAAEYGDDIDLQWNADSTILAVRMTERVQLWTMNNYHYYLKQEIKFGAGSGISALTAWHPEKPLRLLSAVNNDLRRLTYTFEVRRGSVAPPNDLGLVAVVDGKLLKVTPLRTANVPPPMAFDEIVLPANALDVTFNETGTEIAVLHHDFITIWGSDYSSKRAKMATLKQTLDLDNEKSGVGSEKGAIASPSWIGFADSHHVQTRTNHVETSPDESDILGPSLTDSKEDATTTSFRLSDNGTLDVQHRDQTLQISNCTSFITTPLHLIYTTSRHLLKFVHLHQGHLEIPADEPEKDERCRSIERGAKIVTAMPSVYSLVLQMPRGNLETIHPRALVLAGVRGSIRSRDYKKAFLTCRTHRVDMNILHDYIPEQFMRDVEVFIQQIKRTEFVDLFLTSLSEDDVSLTMYRDTITPGEQVLVNGPTRNSSPSETSKINKICDAFLKILRSQQVDRLQNVVTAHVSKNPPDLEAGLKLLSELRLEGSDARLEEAVEHICFLADVNHLYDTALGLYDLEVALLVAQQAQKDPREYVPYLEALHDMVPLRKQFTIDDDLKRYNKAVVHLHVLDAFEEVKAYTVKHELYSQTIDLYRYDNTRLMEVMRLYADFLRGRSRFGEAGVAYEYISDHDSAHAAYRTANMWQECLSSASLAPLPTDEMSSLARDLAESLEEAKNFRAAATIHSEYLNDFEASIRLLCRGFSFPDAMRQVTLRQDQQLLTSIVDPGLVEASAAMTEMLSDMKSQIGAQVPRLRELRQRKVDDPMAFLDGAGAGEVDIPDNLSLAPTDASTTGGTFMTRYTNRSDGTLATNATRKTSKNRRREERKRARGKKGTVYEVEYLENSIGRLIERLNENGDDVAELVRCLMRRGMRERAGAVQTGMLDVMAMIKDTVEEVFTTASVTATTDRHDDIDGEGEGNERPWGGQGVLWEAMRTQRKEAPALKPFPEMTL